MNSRKAFYINELIKSIPGLMILILVVIWGRVLPAVSLSGEKSLLADMEMLTKSSIGMGLVIFYALSVGLMNFQSYKEERNYRQIKNILLLPYKHTQRFIMKLISFIINISSVFLALSIYFLIVFIIEKASAGIYLVFLQTVLRDVLWCVFLFLFFSFIQNFTGNSLFSIFTGFAVLTFYFFFLEFMFSQNNICNLADTSFFNQLNRIINLIDLSFIEMFLRLGLLSVFLLIASYILSKRYRYELIGNMIIYKTAGYILKILFTSATYYILTIKFRFLEDALGKGFMTAIIINTILILFIYLCFHLIIQIGKISSMRFRKQEVITSLLIVVILSLCISTFMNFYEFNSGVRNFNKMLRKGEYVNQEQTGEFLHILFGSHYPFQVSIIERTMTLTVEVPDGSGMPLEIERWFYPTLLFAETVIILNRFPDIDMIDYALDRNNNVLLYDSFNRESIVEITGIEIENMVVSFHDYYQWEEISIQVFEQKKSLVSKE